MSISMMYQFENSFFSLACQILRFSCFTPPPPPNKILALHLWKYTNLNKEKVNFH